MILRRGMNGPEVETLQHHLNKFGMLLMIDGDFGLATETAVLEVQRITGETQSGEADPAFQALLEAQPEPEGAERFSLAGLTFVARHEVGSWALYTAQFQSPVWPGGSSGVTIGVGYDLGFSSGQDFERDWADRLSASDFDDLAACLGVTGPPAQGLASTRQHVRIPFADAWPVFLAQSVPIYWGKVLPIWPEAANLSPPRRAVLLSLVYNRGASLSGDRRREMKAIQTHLANGALDAVAAEIRSMKRLWPTVAGLRRRREEEAELWEQG